MRRVAWPLATGALVSPYLTPAQRVWLLQRMGYEVSDDAWIVGSVIIETDKLTIGHRAVLGYDARVLGRRCGRLTLEDDVVIGPKLVAAVGRHEMGPSSRRAGDVVPEDILIRAGAWLGANVTIPHGVTIGAGAVVAAGAIVTHDVPDNVLAAGVPARVVKELPA